MAAFESGGSPPAAKRESIGDRASMMDGLIRMKEEHTERKLIRERAKQREDDLRYNEALAEEERAAREETRRDRFANLKATMRQVEEQAEAAALVDARAEREKQLALEGELRREALDSLDDERRDHFDIKSAMGRVETEAAAMALVDARAEREKNLALEAARRTETLESLDDERRDHFDIKSAMGRVETEAAAVALVDARAERDKKVALDQTRRQSERAAREETRRERFSNLKATMRRVEEEAAAAALEDARVEREKQAALDKARGLEKATLIRDRRDGLNELSEIKRAQQADELRTRKAGYAHATERSKGRAADARAAREARKAEIRTKADEMRSWKKDFMASLDD